MSNHFPAIIHHYGLWITLRHTHAQHKRHLSTIMHPNLFYPLQGSRQFRNKSTSPDRRNSKSMNFIKSTVPQNFSHPSVTFLQLCLIKKKLFIYCKATKTRFHNDFWNKNCKNATTIQTVHSCQQLNSFQSLNVCVCVCVYWSFAVLYAYVFVLSRPQCYELWTVFQRERALENPVTYFG